MVTLEMIKKAEENLKGVARRTPLIESTYINNKADVYVKCENLQVTGAFKLRGAYTKISSLTEEERKRGIVPEITVQKLYWFLAYSMMRR